MFYLCGCLIFFLLSALPCSLGETVEFPRCPGEPVLFSSLSKEKPNNASNKLFVYIPEPAIGIIENSILLYNDYTEKLECLSVRNFQKRTGLTGERPYFVSLEPVIENVYALSYVENPIFEVVPYNSNMWIFVDEFFNIRKDLPILRMSPDVESSLFAQDAFLNGHDLIVYEDLKHAIILIRETRYFKDIQNHFPNTSLKQIEFFADGLCALDLQTGKEVAALSSNSLFVDFDLWWEYVPLDFQSQINSITDEAEGNERFVVDSTYIDSLTLVDGAYFSQKLLGKSLILINSRYQSTMYLLYWNFRDGDKNDFEIIWKIPSYHSPDPIRKEWFEKWEYVNDPFFGVSNSHDLNIHNLQKGHIAIHDNGSGHRVSNGKGGSCPMTRVAEYKIEMDVESQGHHRITLILSYPKVSEYPEIYFDDAPEYVMGDCYDFWEKINYQPFHGSFRKVDDEMYTMTYSSFFVLFGAPRDIGTSVRSIDKYGNVLNTWYIKDGTVGSYRITELNPEIFRNGIFYNVVDDHTFDDFLLFS